MTVIERPHAQTIAGYADRLTPVHLGHHLDPNQVKLWPYSRLIGRTFTKAVMGHHPYTMIVCQPQLGKSTACSILGPAWVYDLMPRARLAGASYSAPLARRNSRAIRDLLRQREIRTELKPGVEAVDNWETEDGGSYIATTIGGSITGFSLDGIVIDDPIRSAKDAMSQQRRDDQWTWWQSSIESRLQEQTRDYGTQAFVVLIMTRWHEDDLAGRLLKEEGDRWHVLHLPAFADPNIVDPDPLGRAPGEVVEPERFSLERMTDIKRRTDPYTFAALYQGNPAPPEGGLFKRDWWRWLDRAPAVEQRELVFTSWDLARKTDGSFVVGLVMCVTAHGEILILDEFRSQVDYVDSRAAFLRLRAQWPTATHHLIEDAANGTPLIQELRRMGVAGVTPVQPVGSKETRAQAVTALLADGRVFLPGWIDAHAWPLDLVNECAAFPHGTHNDRVDALSQGLRWLQDGVAADGPATIGPRRVSTARGR